ncbi:LysE family transporter [Herbaspirillum sp. YR522]|uniref:LysE family transporter n=1 Tax=Herbaspirillum sp. YR522 TaxID=1144342 RepID=UPI00026F99C6|nr:LysE family transporter [Herbaspirillum sp. YR522]EJN06616.1 putative threonine efflux protein [Herbaspirillum sp. YR522]
MTELFAVITISLLAVVSPGPDFALVTRNSLARSRATGVSTALGIGSGVLVHVGYTLLGLGWLLHRWPWLLDALKLAGALYLVYLGVRMLRSAAAPLAAGHGGHSGQGGACWSGGQAFRTGLLTNVLNPKTSVFIVSLFTQVVGATTPVAIQLGYGLFIALAHVAWFSLVAILFGSPAMRQAMHASAAWIDRVFGVVLVGFGVMLAATNVVAS